MRAFSAPAAAAVFARVSTDNETKARSGAISTSSEALVWICGPDAEEGAGEPCPNPVLGAAAPMMKARALAAMAREKE
jgi:hypothetical protein